MPRPTYSVYVGNIGLTYTGRSIKKAGAAFEEYRNQSEKGYGRAAGETVTLCRNDEPIREFFIPEPEEG